MASTSRPRMCDMPLSELDLLCRETVSVAIKLVLNQFEVTLYYIFF
jgi:hypothetical protein